MNTQNRFYKSMSTPWGAIQQYNRLAEGVYVVHTAGHGGIWLSDARIAELPDEYDPFTGTRRWAEEDEDAALVLQHLGLLSLITEPLELEVTEGDIERGYKSRKALYHVPVFKSDDRKGLYGGPIAEAYQRQTGDVYDEMICSYHLSPVPGGFKLARLCDAARDFLKRYDAGESVAPTTFTLQPYIVYARKLMKFERDDGKVQDDKVNGATAHEILNGNMDALHKYIEMWYAKHNIVKVTHEGNVIWSK